MAEEVELAEDGSPLGTLKVDGKVYRQDRAGELARTATKELARSVSVDVTGDDDADDLLVESYEGYSDEELRKKALQLYVCEGRVATEVAEKLKVPERTVLMWAYKGRWNRAAARELEVRAAEEARALADFRLRHREALLRTQIANASEIQRKLMAAVEEGSIGMKSAAESLANLAKVQNQAMGIADSGVIAPSGQENPEKKKGEGEKQSPLVVVFPGNAAIPVLKKGETIDV